jgi:hypothetical protein
MHRERWLILAAALLFVVALALPAVVSESFPAQSGWDLLRQRAEFSNNGIYAWYANPVLMLALVLGWVGRYRLSLPAAAAGGLLALSILLAPAQLESAGRSLPQFHYGVGFYVWLAAFGAALLAGIAGLMHEKRQPRD